MSSSKTAKPSREELFEKIPVWNAIFTLTIPMIIGSLISMIYNLSDTYFVGMLEDPIQNAAVTLVAPAMTLFYAGTNLFGVGASSLMSRSLGVKDYEKVKRAATTGIYFGFLFAVLLSAVVLIFNGPTLSILGTDAETYEATKQYMFWTVGLGSVPAICSIMFGFLLRAEGQAMQASIGQMSGCVLNIILDPFFILPFGLNKGVVGAGIATFIGNCVACMYFLILLWVKRNTTCITLQPKYFTPKKEIMKEIFAVGIPGVFQNNLNVISMTLLNNLAAGYGANAVAAIGIANKINQLPIQIIFGFSQGVMPLIGYNYAAKNHPRMKETIKKTFIVTLSSLGAVLILFNVAGEPIIRLFMDNDEIVRVGGRFLSGFGISLPFMCIDFMVVGISQSFGMGRHALVFSFLRKAFFEIPFLLILNACFQVYGIAYAQCSSEILMAVIAGFVLLSLMKKTENSL